MTKESWGIKKLGEVCDSINGLWKGKKEPFVNVGVIRNTNFTKECTLNDNNIEYLDVEEKQFATRRLLYGDLIIEKSGGSQKQPVGRVVPFEFLEGDFSFSNFTSVLRIKDKNKLSYKYVYLFLLHTYLSGKTEKIQSNTTGIRNLDFTAYKALPISIPSLPIQEQIVAELDALNDTLKKKRQQLTELDTLAQATFYLLFGDPMENEKGWEVKKMGDIITTLTDYHANGSYEILKKNVTLLNTLDYALMVRTTDLENNNFQNDCIYIDEFAYNYLEKSKVFGGEIIMNKIGSAGKVYMMPFLNRPVSLGMNAFLIRTDTNKTNNIYLFHYLTSPYGSTIINKKVKGAVTKTITKEAVRDLFLPLPPLSLQNQFAEQIEAIEKQKELINQSITEVQKLFDYTMDKYFN